MAAWEFRLIRFPALSHNKITLIIHSLLQILQRIAFYSFICEVKKTKSNEQIGIEQTIKYSSSPRNQVNQDSLISHVKIIWTFCSRNCRKFKYVLLAHTLVCVLAVHSRNLGQVLFLLNRPMFGSPEMTPLGHVIPRTKVKVVTGWSCVIRVNDRLLHVTLFVKMLTDQMRIANAYSCLVIRCLLNIQKANTCIGVR